MLMVGTNISKEQEQEVTCFLFPVSCFLFPVVVLHTVYS